ncbi:BQ2448_1518 [Microbotryum intermedium]|uniref:BQ2448_1518 protein n=1 Tax=Microbotryum intermedium TaxID=269621 RepID=A0A238FE13_9BASI|nr:BQ2448_1518 [Microbotryum intermedium]
MFGILGRRSRNNGKCSLERTTRDYNLDKTRTACIALGIDANNFGTGKRCTAWYNGRCAATCETPANRPSIFKVGTNRRRQSTCVRICLTQCPIG